MRKLPPLHSLRAFEAAARHLHFARAAEELHLDPTAVSHQVRKLEGLLGAALFHRTPRPIRLTTAGEDLYPVLRDALDDIAYAIDNLRPEGLSSLTVAMTMAFANEWFAPRMTSLRKATGIDLIVNADNAPVDVQRGGTDLAIRTQTTPGREGAWTLFREDALIVVAAPSLAEAFPSNPAVPGEVWRAPLIEFKWNSPCRTDLGWAEWFRLADASEPPREFVASFSEESHAIQAAVSGVGVALLSETIVARRLADGDLVKISDLSVPAPPFWFVRPIRRKADVEVERLVQHLLLMAEA
ncbi:LysR family transcriptional regulator [Roseibium sp.]|uniref:LysR family transcriptional regulator n=1 Tax=Roseibium sp. TaxID=1936156 RepID=UPI00329916DF